MTVYLSLFIAIVGVIIYLASEGKPSEIGRLMFADGLLAFLLLNVGPHIVNALR